MGKGAHTGSHICWKWTLGSPDCLPAVMDDRAGWRKRAREGGRGRGVVLGWLTEVNLVVVVVGKQFWFLFCPIFMIVIR